MADNKTSIIITALDATQPAFNSVRNNLSGIQSAAAAVGLSLSAMGMVALVKSSIDAADNLSKLAQKTGTAVETLAGLKFAADQNGTSLEAVANAAKKLSTALVDKPDLFAKMGITAKDSTGAMVQMADLFAAMPDGVNKTALAVKLMGKSGEEMIPFLNQGSAALREQIEQGKLFNPVTAESAKQAELFNDQLDALQAQAGGLGMALVNDLLPNLVNTTTAMTAAAKEGNVLWAVLRGIAGIGKIPFDLYTGSNGTVDVSSKKMIFDLKAQLGQLERNKESGDSWLMRKIFGTPAEIDVKIAIIKNQLAAFEKFGAQGDKKPVVPEAKTGTAPPLETVVSEYDKLIARLKGELVNATAAAQGALHGYNKEQEKALALFASPEWAKMSEKQRIHAAGIMEATIAQGMQSEAQKRAAELDKELVAATVANQTALHGYNKEQAKALELFLSPAWATMSEAERTAAAATLENAIALGEEGDALEKAKKATKDATAARQASMAALSGEYDALFKKLEADQYALSIIGKTKEQIALLSAARGDDALQIKIQEAAQLAATGSDEQRLHVLREQIKLMLELRGVATDTAAAIVADEAIKKQTEDWKKSCEEINRSLTDALMRGFESGKGFGKNFVDTVKNLFNTMVLRPVISAIMSPVSGAISAGMGALGIPGAANAATGAAAGGLFGGAFSGALGAFGSGISTAMSTGIVSGFTTGLSTLGTSGAFASSLGMMLPGLGLGIGALALLFGNKGTPTASTGHALIDYDAAGKRTGYQSQYGVRNDQTDSFVAGMQATYAGLAKSLGIGTVATQFGYAANTGKDGKAPMFGLSGGGFAQSETAYSEAAVKEAASRAVFAALQGSELPGYLSKVFAGLDAAKMSGQNISDTLAYAGTLKQVRTALTETRTPLEIATAQMTDLTKELHTSASTFKTDFVAAIDGGITPDLLNKWGTLGTLIQQATDTASASVLSFTNDVMGLVNGIHESAISSAWNMQYGMQDNAGKYGMLDTKGAGLDAQMRGTTDIYKIADYAQKQIDLLNQSWGLLSAEQQAATFGQFQGKLTGIDNFVTQSGADAISLKKADNQMLSDAVAAAVEKALATLAIKLADAAIAQAASTSAMVNVVREPANVRVTVIAPRGSEVSLE